MELPKLRVGRVESGARGWQGTKKPGSQEVLPQGGQGEAARRAARPFLEMTSCAPALEKRNALPLSGSL